MRYHTESGNTAGTMRGQLGRGQSELVEDCAKPAPILQQAQHDKRTKIILVVISCWYNNLKLY